MADSDLLGGAPRPPQSCLRAHNLEDAAWSLVELSLASYEQARTDLEEARADVAAERWSVG